MQIINNKQKNKKLQKL